jgi:hypothetical protein
MHDDERPSGCQHSACTSDGGKTKNKLLPRLKAREMTLMHDSKWTQKEVIHARK